MPIFYHIATFFSFGKKEKNAKEKPNSVLIVAKAKQIAVLGFFAKEKR